MKDIIPAKKESPILGLSGMGGGVGSNIVAGLPKTTKYIDEVFSTYLYKGNSTARAITNGIDLSAKGGLVWVKTRNDSQDHQLVDTVRGANNVLATNTTDDVALFSNRITGFNDNGFNLGTAGQVNGTSAYDYCSWTFRKQKGFFDIIKYTGTGSALTVAHELGSVPGCIIIKRLDAASYDWTVWHKELTGSEYLSLNLSNAAASGNNRFDQGDPTATHFSIGIASDVNASGGEYIAYLFGGGESTAATARSVDFDGSGDWLSVPATPSTIWDVGNIDFTMECWAKFDSHNSHDGIFHNVTNSGWTGGSWIFEPVSGNLCFYYYNTGGGLGNVIGGPIPLGQWQHMAIVKSGSTIRIFQDGILTGIDAVNGTIRPGTNPLLIGGQCVGQDMDGKVSNVRITLGQALYTSSFRPPTEPLTTTSQGAISSNVKLLCCNNSSVTGSTVTTGTITANGGPTAKIDSPFDDPDSLKFGENEDQNLIKCGSYIGNGSTDGPHIECGWEPQWILFKVSSDTDPWYIADSMRAIVTDGADNTILPGSNQGENVANWTLLDVNSTGWKPTTADPKINGSNKEYIYIALRRHDGYVGKPAEEGTDVFAMDVGNGSAVIPPGTFDSGFPVDFGLMREPAASSQWYTTTRLQGYGYVRTNDTNVEAQGNPSFAKDSNVGWGKDSYGANWMSWAWRRGAGFDVVAYTGNNTNGRVIPHSLNKAPEMIWIKNRSAAESWVVGHKGVNGGTNPWEETLRLNDTMAEYDYPYFMDVAPTSTHFTVHSHDQVNGASSNNYIAMLFASVDKICKVGSYTGPGNSDLTITTGFQPRFILIKNTSSTYGWAMYDTVRGIGTGSSDDKRILLNSAGVQTSQDDLNVTSTGFTLKGGGWSGTVSLNSNFIYYAHA